MVKNRKLAFKLSLISGLLLIISGTTGVSGIAKLEYYVLNIVNLKALTLLFMPFLIVASFGGAAVMFGGYQIYKGRDTIGRFLVMLGSGAGLISFGISVFFVIITQEIPLSWRFSFTSIGFVLALVIQIISRRK